MADVFDICFIVEPCAAPPAGAAFGEIRIGSFRERFQSDLSFWNKVDYERQWRKAASTILESDRAAMITSLGDPSAANFIRWWVLYREGEMVFLQEHILFLGDLATPFDPDVAESFVNDRQTISADGEEVSEWMTSVETLRVFLVST